MGLLDQLAGDLLGDDSSKDIGKAALDLVQNQEGGLAGLLEKLKASGLTDQVSSWVGTGTNQAVSPDQLANALGPDTLNALAAKFGLDASALSDGLAGALPQLVDKLTPNGSLEGHQTLLQQGLGLLSGLFKH